MILSIIIPVFKVERYIEECLRSVFASEVESADYEVILVNDGTPDRSMDIARDICRGRDNVKYVEQENKGLSAARMAGLSLACGDYVWFVDSDDMLSEGAVKTVIQALESNGYPDLLITPVLWKSRVDSRSVLDLIVKEDAYYDSGKELLRSGTCPPWMAQRFITKRLLFGNKDLHFPIGCIHEDLYYSAVVLYLSRDVVLIKEAQYIYRLRQDSIMSARNIRSSYDVIEVYKELESFWEKSVLAEDKEWFSKSLLSVLLQSYRLNQRIFGSREFRTFRRRNWRYVRQQYCRHSQGNSFLRRCADLFMIRCPGLYDLARRVVRGRDREMLSFPSYSVAIRTLGTAGRKYEEMIRSLEAQTVKADRILVYIPEGYALPDRVGSEEFVTCTKGMVSQRALDYGDVDSDYLLLCDDDIFFEPDSVERLFLGLFGKGGDAISANVYHNDRWPLGEKFIQAAFHGLYPSVFSRYAFKVRRSAYFSYRLRPRKVMATQCFAGGCVLLKKSVYQSIHLWDEVWMDQAAYPLGEDLVFAYKLHRYGYDVLVHSDCGITHQDAQTSHLQDKQKDYYISCYMRYLIWYRSVYLPSGTVSRIFCKIAFYNRWFFRYSLAVLARWSGRNAHSDKDMKRALKDARAYAESGPFSLLPKWDTVR